MDAYETWKREGFDRDPIGRAESGVRCFRILRSNDDPALVTIELEFDSQAAAEAFRIALTVMWRLIGDRFGWRQLPEARIFELAAAGSY